MDDRLRRQLEFLLELDKAKSVYRQSHVTAEDRNETDAEHMWHLALFVLVLAEHAGEAVDPLHALKLVLLHDVVEIHAGDAYIYDEAAAARKEQREIAAADRIYALLPDDQRDEFRALWEEFEAKATPEARFAGSVDRLAPLRCGPPRRSSSTTPSPRVTWPADTPRARCRPGARSASGGGHPRTGCSGRPPRSPWPWSG